MSQRHIIRAQQRQLERDNIKRPDRLTQATREQWPNDDDSRRTAVWISRRYLVQEFDETDGTIRLSVCRTQIGNDGHWRDGLTWDELQDIKRQCGYGDRCAIEIYPADGNLVNIANMRHLWIAPEGKHYGWQS